MEDEKLNYEKQHLFVKMQTHPQLLRRPLPPKFFKLSLCKKKIHTAKTGETKSPHVVFIQDETISIKRDETSFPDVVSRSKSPIPIKIQNLCFDYHVRKRARKVATISTRPAPTKSVHWHIPDTATGSIFFPSSYSASTRVFGKGTDQIKKSRKSKRMLKDVYASKALEGLLILSSVFSKPLITCELIPGKLKKPYPRYQPLSRSPSSTYQHILTDVSEAAPSPLPSTTTSKPERQWLKVLPQSSSVKLSVTQYPVDIYLPAPASPRRPHRQSMIETLATDNEYIETVSREVSRKPTEVYDKTRLIESDRNIIRGEGFKTITATRYETITAMTKLAIVNCHVHGRNALNLKGYFLLNCPDLTCLAFQLVYLNLSFNDLCYFPTEVFCLKNLQVLKLRNNPIKEIPSEIQKLKYLRIFSIAFNWITVLPPGLFRLYYLEELDISYNEIRFIPNEIQKLRSLEKLNIDGIELSFLPSGILKLNLIKIHIENNFILPCFWKENSLNNPQRLTQIIAFFIVKNNLQRLYDDIPVKIQKLLQCTSRCDWCHGPKFGNGFRVIRPYDIFGALQLPVMFYVCSSHCYRKVKEGGFISRSIPDKKIAINLETVNE
ncbi:leucine-rich repeat-containing protein 63 isoform X1 [Microcebus murinus]|nr:leucine-rich repeat-containing protein 63 isoform X2 [Microcebus murinus]